MAKTYRRILIFIVILGVLMGLLGKKFAGDQYVNTEPRKNTECTLTKRVFDDADVLTDEEEKNLEALIAEKEELIGGDLVLITTNDASLDTMEKLRDYAQNYYKENKLGWDQPIGSGAIYVDDWETRYTWLATRGKVDKPDSRRDTKESDVPYKYQPDLGTAWLSCGVPHLCSSAAFRTGRKRYSKEVYLCEERWCTDE